MDESSGHRVSVDAWAELETIVAAETLGCPLLTTDRRLAASNGARTPILTVWPPRAGRWSSSGRLHAQGDRAARRAD